MYTIISSWGAHRHAPEYIYPRRHIRCLFFPLLLQLQPIKLKPCTHTRAHTQTHTQCLLLSSLLLHCRLFNALKIVFSLAGGGVVLPPCAVPLSFLSASHVSHLMQALALTFPFPSTALCFDWVKSSLSQIFLLHTGAAHNPGAIASHLESSAAAQLYACSA